eukprot:SAG22_NODE_958_length_6301_cov_4.995324_6_plen_77_part_00
MQSVPDRQRTGAELASPDQRLLVQRLASQLVRLGDVAAAAAGREHRLAVAGCAGLAVDEADDVRWSTDRRQGKALP